MLVHLLIIASVLKRKSSPRCCAEGRTVSRIVSSNLADVTFSVKLCIDTDLWHSGEGPTLNKWCLVLGLEVDRISINIIRNISMIRGVG